MKLSAHTLIPLMAVVAACGGSGSGEPNPNTAQAEDTSRSPAIPADSHIAALVYDSSYSVPPGFFVDERADTSRSYTVHHVLDQSHSFEVCTDDYAVAEAWENTDNASRSVQGYFVESYDNERYFEFVRELAYNDDIGNIGDPTSPGFSRIFKCSNTSRDGVDRSLLSGYAGTLNAQPLNEESVRVFAEYFWQFTYFPYSRKKVIQSTATRTEDVLQQALLLAFATNQGTGRCDLLEVVQWQFSADRLSGEISRRFELLHSFEARLENGAPTLCS